MSYCHWDGYCPFYAYWSGPCGVHDLNRMEVALLSIHDAGSWTYQEVMDHLANDPFSLPGSVGWEDFLRRICHRFCADVEEEFGPFAFESVWSMLHGRVDRERLRQLHRNPRLRPPTRGAEEDDCSRLQHHVLGRCGAWVLAEPDPVEVDDPADEHLLFACRRQPVRLAFAKVRAIVADQSWWEVPGYDPRWERLLVQRLTGWLVDIGWKHRIDATPWRISITGKPGRDADAHLTLTREGRSLTLSGPEARHLFHRGGWERIPCYAPQWHLALSQVLHHWWWEADPTPFERTIRLAVRDAPLHQSNAG